MSQDDALEATLPAGEAPAASTIPATIGRYQIVRVLGRGGMGTVYAAHDPELGREVALKSLHAHDHGDLARAERLRREAQALARVVHPNVVAVHDAGIADGTPFLVMQRIDGETLDDHLRRHERSTAQILALFDQIGRGLQAIHDAGLVHRDMKPTNVLVDRHGVPHVSDLGLARIGAALEPLEPGDGGAASSSGTLTRGGAGTPAYMAPEQYEAKEPTAACDQFSFAVTLWEALFGVRPFAGTTSEDMQTRIRRGDLRAPGEDRKVPANVTRALRRALAHAPDARFPSMTALLDALRPPRRIGAAIALGGGAALALGVAWFASRGEDRAATPDAAIARAARPAANRAVRVTFADGCEEYPSFSPDGATIYFDGEVGSNYHLYALDVATAVARELTRTDGWDYASEVSPDGRRIAFIRKSSEGSGVFVGELDALDAARRIGTTSMHPTWSPDGAHVWTYPEHELVRHDAVTGAPGRRLTVPDGKTPLLGRELVDGRFVVLAASGETSGYADAVYLYGADAAPPERLIDGGSFEEVLTLAPEGDAVWIAAVPAGGATELLRLPFDGGAPTSIQGAGIAARKRVAVAGGNVVWSDCVVHTGLATVTTVDGAPGFVELPRGNWADAYPEVVPGTTRVLFLSERADGLRIWQVDRARPGPVERIPFGDLEPVRITISPDGETIAAAEGAEGLFVAPMDGSAPPRLLFAESGELSPAFSRDGTTIYFDRYVDGAYRLAAIPVVGGEPRWIAPARSYMAAPSPTADLVAYLSSNAEGAVPVLLDLATGRAQPVPGVARHPWTHLRWSADGKRLLVARDRGLLVEIDPTTGRELRRLETGTAMLAGAAYAGDELIVGLTRWSGDLWIAPLTP